LPGPDAGVSAVARRIHEGITLVELLVVVVVIGVIVALLVPAITGAREAARRHQCQGNQRELAVALQQYEMAKEHLPGYINRFGGRNTEVGSTPMNWAVVLLPYLGRDDLWREARKGNFDGLDVQLPELLCPSDEPGKSTSFVANCGMPDGEEPPLDGKPPDSKASGVFHNLFDCDRPLVAASEMRDGPQHTLLLSENVEVGYDSAPGTADGWRKDEEGDVGMVWVWVPHSAALPTEIPDDPCFMINACRDSGASYARPSSFHSGGVNVTYCDGHQQFLSERIAYITFQHLMTPASAASTATRPQPLPAYQDPELPAE